MHSSTPVVLTRRGFLAVASGTVGLAFASGCAVPAGEDSPDPVLDLIRGAERDARQFAAADSAQGAYADALRRLADVRRIHAERLAELIVPDTSPPQQPTPGPAGPAQCPPVEEVRIRLREDAARAAGVAENADGIRAELTGAVSAACTAAVEVVLS